MTTYQLHPIGTIHNNGEDMFITLSPEYIPALQALDGFSHLQVLWWFSDFDTKEPGPYWKQNSPTKMPLPSWASSPQGPPSVQTP